MRKPSRRRSQRRVAAPAASLERRHPTRHLSGAEVDELKALREVLRETSDLLDRKGY